jgi:hypothetical protein
MQHEFLQMFGRRGDDQEQFLQEMRAVARLSGGFLVVGGIYALVLALAVWE